MMKELYAKFQGLNTAVRIGIVVAAIVVFVGIANEAVTVTTDSQIGQ